MNTRDTAEPGEVASDALSVAQKVGTAGNPKVSSFTRLSEAASAIAATSRLLPAGMRLVRRYPLGSAVVVAAALCAAYWLSAVQHSKRAGPHGAYIRFR